jgi:hypothetical protein
MFDYNLNISTNTTLFNFNPLINFINFIKITKITIITSITIITMITIIAIIAIISSLTAILKPVYTGLVLNMYLLKQEKFILNYKNACFQVTKQETHLDVSD